MNHVTSQGLTPRMRPLSGRDVDVRTWFEDKVQRPRVAKHFIARALRA